MGKRALPYTVESCQNYIVELRRQLQEKETELRERVKEAKEIGRSIELERIRTSAGTLPSTVEGCWRYIEWLRQQHTEKVNKRNRAIRNYEDRIAKLEEENDRLRGLVGKQIYIARLRAEKIDKEQEA